jgi:N-acetylglucosamine-6-phosphate deacetylase
MPDGTLSGSALSMLKAIKNCVHKAGISTPEALRMASTYPAKLLSIDNYYGQLKLGQPANLVLMDDNLKLKQIIFKSHVITP